MEMERKAIYNLLRMNWLRDPSIKAEFWQIEDYRNKSLSTIFNELEALQISMDFNTFLAFAEMYDSPEDLTDSLFFEDVPVRTQDHAYLLIFELWRRLLPEKPSLSIFCDELDYQIYLYDEGAGNDSEGPQDILSNLAALLEENADKGADPEAIFLSIEAHCGNDLESFLYDFIAEKIDEELYDYAIELIEIFYPFVNEKSWFDFLRARTIAPTNIRRANEIVQELIDDYQPEINLEFNLEVLQFLAKRGDQRFFLQLANQTLDVLQTEDEFQDLLMICSDYYQYLDLEKEEELTRKLMRKRAHNSLEAPISSSDEDLLALKQLLNDS